MRLHTDTITLEHLNAAVRAIPGKSVTMEWSTHGSRSKAHAFEIGLEGYGDRHTRQRNYGDGGMAATWDDWGFFIAYLYEIDDDAFWGSASYKVYENAWKYHALTFDRFNIASEDFPANPLPALKMRELARLRSEAWRSVNGS